MLARSTRPLSARQSQALAFIERYHAEHGHHASFRQIGEALGITNNAVNDLLTACERKGHLTRVPGRARALTLVKVSPASSASSVAIPLCLNCQYDIEYEHGEPDPACLGCKQLREVYEMGRAAGVAEREAR
jgi:SOS-response transcriptional repressor LexA